MNSPVYSTNLLALQPKKAAKRRTSPVDSYHPVVNLSKAEVSTVEREQLQAFFLEFRDRISHIYDLEGIERSRINSKKLLKAGRIKEKDTPWIYDTVLVRKRDGSLRVCLDFRPLNEITIPDHYPLPRIDDILGKIAWNKYYTSLDLASVYMQLLLSPESQAKCGRAMHRGVYQFVYLPFGLKNAGA
ncbi:unnamed protein product [Cylicocyclus nassatus]|uniref:Reverse transcriptase domain-containing protein n=1 Tax=Cylicocyclus nassatus TaxID=53992 RepID=A0AA36H2R9_CYLNA|nr:unnamed protein product [Cylicocyclus nassatus]